MNWFITYAKPRPSSSNWRPVTREQAAAALCSDRAYNPGGVGVMLEDGIPLCETLPEGAHIQGGRTNDSAYVDGKRSRWTGDPEQILAALEAGLPAAREFWLRTLRGEVAA